MSILIRGMTMPTTGLYFVGVDNSKGRDKTVITVERMLGNRDVRQIVGSFELVEIPPHGDLIDREETKRRLAEHLCKMKPPIMWPDWNDAVITICTAPIIIPASEEGE